MSIGYKHSEETRKKMNEARKLYYKRRKENQITGKQ